jgi:hypothetical protein
MSSAEFIEHRGTKVLLMDFSNSSDAHAVIKTVEEAITLVAGTNQPGSLLGLVDLSGVQFTREIQAAVKRMAGHNRPYMKFIAIVGLGGVRALMLRLMLRLKKRTNHKLMSYRQEALDWLVVQ